MEFINNNIYNYVFNQSADPRVKNWLFMANPSFFVLTSIMYLFIVYKYLPFLMLTRKPLNLNIIMRVYNIFQIFGCSYLVYGMLMAGWWKDYSFICQRSDYSSDPKSVQMVTLMYWTVLVKFLELSETIFFVLRKKYNQVTVLHVYHHISTLFISWISTKYGGSGMSSFPMMLNSFIHIIMYIYYFLASMGPNIQNKLKFFKSKITMLQMLQFGIMIIFAAQALNPNCDMSRIVAMLFIIDICIILGFFINFYCKNYIDIKEKRK